MIESVLFNRKDPEFSVYAPEPTPDQIERTPNLQGASLTDAFRFGNRARFSSSICAKPSAMA